ncbi:hypothetical protein N4R57_03600 [Rhodobacteraceae bacterium D3-12]|nr:hypothetical protein N4R57_03600 [Rhodobacteraceae bacterium D3-12]
MLRTTFSLSGLAGAMILSGCAGDPLAGVKKIDEVDVVGPSPVVEAVAAPIETDQNATLFQRLMRKREVAPGSGLEPAKDTTSGTGPKAEAPEEGASATGQVVGTGTGTGAAADAKVEKVVLTPEPEGKRGGGLFGSRKAKVLSGPDAREVAAGEVLPFGEIARACHMKRGQLGKEVSKYPERGTKYRVFDSAPGNVGLHTFYVTGFKDGCPRQFTAALAVFGTAGMYESLRYTLPVKARSKKPTDKAYEKVKSKVCGVSRTKPCGAKVSRMEKGTVFLSLYNRFEGAQGWTNLLLSDGAVLAKDVQG